MANHCHIPENSLLEQFEGKKSRQPAYPGFSGNWLLAGVVYVRAFVWIRRFVASSISLAFSCFE